MEGKNTTLRGLLFSADSEAEDHLTTADKFPASASTSSENRKVESESAMNSDVPNPSKQSESEDDHDETSVESKVDDLSLFSLVTLSNPSAGSQRQSLRGAHPIPTFSTGSPDQLRSASMSPVVSSSEGSNTGSTSPVGDHYPNMWSAAAPGSPFSQFSGAADIGSPAFLLDTSSSKGDNFLIDHSPESQELICQPPSSVHHNTFSPLTLEQTDFISHTTTNMPGISSSPHKLDSDFGSLPVQLMAPTNDLMFCSTSSQALSSSFCQQDMNPALVSSPNCRLMRNFGVAGHSSHTDSDDTKSNLDQMLTGTVTKTSPSTSARSEPTQRRFFGEFSKEHPSGSSTNSTFTRTSMEDNGNKSDSGVGDSGSDSQQSPVSYASLTPWTTKFLNSDYAAAPSSCDSLPLHLDSFDGQYIHALSPVSTKSHLQSRSSKCPDYSLPQSPYMQHSKEDTTITTTTSKKLSAKSHKTQKTSLKILPNKEHRFKRTAEALHKSGLMEVAMKTGNLMRRNRELQKELDQFRLDALGFIKSVIKHPQNRDYIRNVLSSALSSNSSRNSKPSVMSVVVSAAAAAVKLEATSTSMASTSGGDGGSTETPPITVAPTESNFLGVDTGEEPVTMELG